MTESEWLACTDSTKMLAFLRGRASERKLRLFAVACCRRAWPALQFGKGHEAVEMAERYADGLASPRELDAARAGIEHEAKNWERWVPYESADLENAEAAWAAVASMKPPGGSAFLKVIEHAANAATGGGRRWLTLPDGWRPSEAKLSEVRAKLSEEVRAQSDVLRDIFGPFPFRPETIDPAWLTPEAVTLAHAIYEERAFDRMPEMAQALEVAACDNQDILQHCRSQTEHVRGCWVVDALLWRS